jgi:putative redox protein
MEMEITFPGGARVDASFGGLSVKTDQPVQGGGTSSAATPFATFLASIGTCAGIYVLGFCQQRGLPTQDIKIIQRMQSNPMTGLVA